MRRIATFVIVTVVVAVGSLWWLRQGDVRGAVEPVLAEWDGAQLAQQHGISDAVREDPAP